MPKPRPTKAELLAAADKTILDVIDRGLKVLFCGINPGLYTAAIGHHYGRPGNRFWPSLHAGGFTPRLLDPSEELELLPLGYGLTNVVARASAGENDLTSDEIRAGGKILRRKVLKYRPRVLAVCGLGAYRVAFDRPKAVVGPQEDHIGETKLWALPNPSGLNAHYQVSNLAVLFRTLREFVEESTTGREAGR